MWYFFVSCIFIILELLFIYMNNMMSMKPMMEMKNEEEDHQEYVEFCEKTLPEIKDWQVGKTYRLQLEVEQVESELEEMGDKKMMKAKFKVLSVKPMTGTVPTEKVTEAVTRKMEEPMPKEETE